MSMGIRFIVSVPDFGIPDVRQVLAAIAAAQTRVVPVIKQIWMQRALALDIRGSGDYLRGIGLGSDENVTVQTTGMGESGFSVTTSITNTAPHAIIVEEGHVAFSLPDRIDWSGPNVKRSKYGVPYLSIPFGHSANTTPNGVRRGGMTRGTQRRMMSAPVYQAAKRLDATNRQNAGPQRSASGTLQAADRYTRHGPNTRLRDPRTDPGTTKDKHGRTFEHWRDARTTNNADGSVTSNPAWGSSKYDGMMRSSQGAGGSRYTTIRTITPNSPGWRIPQLAGKHVIRSVRDEIQGGETGAALTRLILDEAYKDIARQIGLTP